MGSILSYFYANGAQQSTETFDVSAAPKHAEQQSVQGWNAINQSRRRQQEDLTRAGGIIKSLPAVDPSVAIGRTASSRGPAYFYNTLNDVRGPPRGATYMQPEALAGVQCHNIDLGAVSFLQDERRRQAELRKAGMIMDYA